MTIALLPRKRTTYHYTGFLGYRWPRVTNEDRKQRACSCHGCATGLYRQSFWSEDWHWEWLGFEGMHWSRSHYEPPKWAFR